MDWSLLSLTDPCLNFYALYLIYDYCNDSVLGIDGVVVVVWYVGARRFHTSEKHVTMQNCSCYIFFF